MLSQSEVNPLNGNIIGDDGAIQYTPANHQAWLAAQKDFKNGNTFSLDDLRAKYR